MPTKTTSKSGARKPSASKTAAKASPAHKPVVTASKARPAPAVKKAEPAKHSAHSSTPATKARSDAPAKTDHKPAATPRRDVETVSLIDEKKPRKKTPEGEKKTGFLPPISRILEPPAAVPKATEPVVAPPVAVVAPAPPEPTAPVADEAAAPEEEPKNVIHIKPPILVKELATGLGLKNFQLIKELMTDFNVFVNQNQTIEPDIATKIAEKHGFVLEKEVRVKGGGVHKVEQVIVAPPPPVIEKEEELKSRAPIITFMGHVDHGKTSLMDAIRKTRVTASEAGGITQHIGAYRVEYKGQPITFLDTPGHAAFTAMRARGASVTDIVVLVVAADDGLMPQTIEAISHAKAAAHVEIMVAINKIDLPGANIDRVKKQLQEKDLTPEDWGGKTVVTVPVSATKGTNIDQLLEMMLLQAEVMDLKASPTAKPRGTVIEAQVEAGRGPTATIIVQMGTLKVGDPFICGDYSGKVKSLIDDQGNQVKEAGPSTPVKVLGFTGLPNAGDELLVMSSEREAKTLSEERLEKKRTGKLASPQRATLETLLEAPDGKKLLRS